MLCRFRRGRGVVGMFCPYSLASLMAQYARPNLNYCVPPCEVTYQPHKLNGLRWKRTSNHGRPRQITRSALAPSRFDGSLRRKRGRRLLTGPKSHVFLRENCYRILPQLAVALRRPGSIFLVRRSNGQVLVPTCMSLSLFSAPIRPK